MDKLAFYVMENPNGRFAAVGGGVWRARFGCSCAVYAPGMNWVVIVLFCVIPMVAWAATLIAMKGYSLTGDRMKEIQAVNRQRKEAIDGGMSLEEAMEKYK